MQNKMLTVKASIDAPLEKVWDCWTKPEHITKWNFASDDWHSPHAENDLRPGGKFVARMESKDGTMGFDFGGIYDAVRDKEYIEYTLGDGRKVKVNFASDGPHTSVVESFDPENENPLELQQGGWQTILDNFKKYVEGSK